CRWGGSPHASPQRPPLAARTPFAPVPGRRPPLWLSRREPGVVVSLLRRPRSQALGLLRVPPDADQRRCRVDRLLLRRSQRVLRPVLPDERAVLTAALCATAFVAGITGTWSPWGLSMVETPCSPAHPGMRWTTRAACATFTLGALAGGALTFGTL